MAAFALRPTLLFALFGAVAGGALLAWPADEPASARATAALPPAPPTAPPAAPAEPVPPISTEGLVLYGVTGGGASGRAAVIGDASGAQRLVPIGRLYRAGLTLSEVGLSHVVLSDGRSAARIDLRRYGAAPTGPAGAGSQAAAPGAETEHKIRTAALRHALRPVVTDGRTGGYAVRAADGLGPLSKAGLGPGDVIVSVNGSQFDEERMTELSWEIANATKTELIVVRNGRKIKIIV